MISAKWKWKLKHKRSTHTPIHTHTHSIDSKDFGEKTVDYLCLLWIVHSPFTASLKVNRFPISFFNSPSLSIAKVRPWHLTKNHHAGGDKYNGASDFQHIFESMAGMKLLCDFKRTPIQKATQRKNGDLFRWCEIQHTHTHLEIYSRE